MRKLSIILSLSVLAGLAACGGAQTRTIPGTRVPDTDVNRTVIERLEEYRMAMERKDAAALAMMASERYWEDGGTPTGSDDYGFEKLQEVLRTRFAIADDIRYSMRYVSIRQACPEGSDGLSGCRAHVEVLIDASFTVPDARGEPMRRDKRDQNEIVLEHDGDKWRFLSGM